MNHEDTKGTKGHEEDNGFGDVQLLLLLRTWRLFVIAVYLLEWNGQ